MNPGWVFIFCSCSSKVPMSVTSHSKSRWARVSSRYALAGPIALDEVVGGAVVAELGLRLALQLRDDVLGQHLAELNAPLIERIDDPDGALGEHAVLVQRDELSERLGREPLGEDRVRGAIALEHPMGNERVRRAFGLDLLARLAEGQRLGLCEHVRQQEVVMPTERVQGLAEGDEVTRDEPGPLVDQLVERMLT